ncbi:MAG: preprotein translocase subunit SecY [Chloroflexi bacterium]|nr:preprotein translocase subunit SecY [Chloroflexota bacterium]MCL5109919.1 preprotein translocase subunit SecY [Chloroflexota bacterium]
MSLLQAVLNAFRLPDLRRRLLFTFAILVIFRFLAHVPVPGVNLVQLRNLFASSQLLGLLDLFSGGAMRNLSVATMGVYPYITSTIIIQLLIPAIPQLKEMSQEGEAGRRRLNQIMHWLTVPLAALQGYSALVVLSQQGIVASPDLFGANALNTWGSIISMVAGTIVLVWMGELITENGIGNGVSILIFGGIVANMPQILGGTLVGGGDWGGLFLFGALGLITVAAIVVVQEAQRRIPVQYAKRIRGTRMYGGQSTHIPLKVNSAGMIPLIFAMSIMLLPSMIAQFFMTSSVDWVASIAQFFTTVLGIKSPVYWIAYFLLVVGFTFFYTYVIFQQQNLSENLQKYGGFIPGIRPGKPTSDYLNRVLGRITWLGAIFLGVIAVLPFFAQNISTTLVVSSTGLLIVVGVVLDTMKQLEAQLMMRHYEGFIK